MFLFNLLASFAVLSTLFLQPISLAQKAPANCGAELTAKAECSVNNFDKHHPKFFETQKDMFKEMRECFINNGCKDPEKIVREEIKAIINTTTVSTIPEPVSKNMSKGQAKSMRRRKRSIDMVTSEEFLDCFSEDIVRKIIFKEMQSCMGKMLPGYKLPDLSHQFAPEDSGYKMMDPQMSDGSLTTRKKRQTSEEIGAPTGKAKSAKKAMAKAKKMAKKAVAKKAAKKKLSEKIRKAGFEWKKTMDKIKKGDSELSWVDKSGEDSYMILAASSPMGGMENFDLEDIETAAELIFMVHELACPGDDERVKAEGCLKALSRKYWSQTVGECKTPVAMAFHVNDKLKTFCSDEAKCESSVSAACTETYMKEPDYLCDCACTLPLKEKVRTGIKKGLLKCMKLPEDILLDQDLAKWIYDLTVYKAEIMLEEFCSLTRVDPCAEVFGKNMGKGKGIGKEKGESKSSKKGKTAKKAKKAAAKKSSKTAASKKAPAKKSPKGTASQKAAAKKTTGGKKGANTSKQQGQPPGKQAPYPPTTTKPFMETLVGKVKKGTAKG